MWFVCFYLPYSVTSNDRLEVDLCKGSKTLKEILFFLISVCFPGGTIIVKFLRLFKLYDMKKQRKGISTEGG